MKLWQTVKNRGPLWVAANLFFSVVDKTISWLLYPLAITAYGLEAGTGLMMVLSFFYCWGLLVAYDRLSSTWWRDLFGFETVKKAGWRTRAWIRRRTGTELYRSTTNTRYFKVAQVLTNIFGFFVINVATDPMTYVVLTRPLNRYGLGRREWALFIASVVTSCTLWALVMYLGLESAWAVAPELMEHLTSWVRNLMPGT